MDKFRGKYRIQSNRMPGWDYAGDGIYFITLVTQNRECNLGKIFNIIYCRCKIINQFQN